MFPWMFVILIILVFAAFKFFNKKEKFSFDTSFSKKAFQTITDKLYSNKDVTAKPTSPKSSFEDSTYIPAFYKVQTKFPRLTKKKNRVYNLE